MSAPEKSNLVQIGWFCHHGQGLYDPETRQTAYAEVHREWKQREDGTWKAKKRPGVVSSMSHIDRFGPGAPTAAACELATPVYVSRESIAAVNHQAQSDWGIR